MLHASKQLFPGNPKTTHETGVCPLPVPSIPCEMLKARPVLRQSVSPSPSLCSPCAATRASRSEGNFNVNVDPSYLEGASFLKTIGYTNPAEIARILDVAMNPGSMFADYRSGKQATNASARLLSVKDDMEPVIEYLLSRNISKGDVTKVVSGHPAVLSYSVQDRLEPFWKYLASLGVQDDRIAEAVVARPSLLGLEVNKNLEKIIDYLKYIETPPEQIVKYLLQSI